ncbi:MAG: hypothetical protein IJ021_07655 [Clostridia bacterium]|nr:hypothetical protein [Clostridia bacterium]
MELSRFEAAAYYCFLKSERKTAFKCLVLDTDDCSAGFCSCTEEGKPTLVRKFAQKKPHNLWKEIEELAAERFAAEAVAAETQAQLGHANAEVRKFLNSARIMNGTAFTFGGRAFSCAELESMLAPVKEALLALLSEVDEAVPYEETDSAKIILLGRAQAYPFVEFYVREYFSADPLLPDERFVNSEFKDPAEKIADIGREAFEKESKVPYFALVVSEGEGHTTRELAFNVAKDGSAKEFLGPVFVVNGDTFKVRSEGKTSELALPYRADPNGECVELAVGKEGESFYLYIKRGKDHSRIYSAALV